MGERIAGEKLWDINATLFVKSEWKAFEMDGKCLWINIKREAREM